VPTITTTTINAEAAKMHFDLIWGAHLDALPAGAKLSHNWDVMEDRLSVTGTKEKFTSKPMLATQAASFLAAQIAAAETGNTYIGIGFLSPGVTRGRGKGADVTALPALWIDVDFDEGTGGNHKARGKSGFVHPTEQEALDLINGMFVEPTILVRTGGGFHAWYALDRLLIPEEFELLDRWKEHVISVFRKAERHIDEGPFDRTRVLRLAGMANRKTVIPFTQPDGTPILDPEGKQYFEPQSRPVTIHAINPDARYPVEFMQSIIPHPVAPEAVVKTRTINPANTQLGQAASDSVRDLWNSRVASSELFDHLGFKQLSRSLDGSAYYDAPDHAPNAWGLPGDELPTMEMGRVRTFANGSYCVYGEGTAARLGVKPDDGDTSWNLLACALCNGDFREAERLAELCGYDPQKAVALWIASSRNVNDRSKLPAHNLSVLERLARIAQTPKSKPDSPAQVVGRFLAENYELVSGSVDGDLYLIPLGGVGRAVDGDLVAAQAYQESIGTEIPATVMNRTLQLSYIGVSPERVRKVHVGVRVAEVDGAIYIDLNDRANEAVVRVTADRWDLLQGDHLKECPVLWATPASAGRLPQPKEDQAAADKFWALWSCLDASVIAQLKTWLTSAFRPSEPCPILNLSGASGSGKSSLATAIGGVVEGNVKRLGESAMKNENDYQLSVATRRVTLNDNFSKISQQINDLLATIVTGKTTEKRKLYHDREIIYVTVMPALIITSIGLIGAKADLITRCLNVDMGVRSDGVLSESDLQKIIESSRSAVLAETLDNLVAVLAAKRDAAMRATQRMAAFECALQVIDRRFGLDGTGESGHAAWLESLKGAQSERIEGDVMAAVVAEVIMDGLKGSNGTFRATATAFLEELSARRPPGADWKVPTSQGMGTLIRNTAPHLLGVSYRTLTAKGRVSHVFTKDSEEAK
jgi:hypothetical protein